MTRRAERVRRAALRFALLAWLTPAVLGQTPPGMVAVPSFDSVPAPSRTSSTLATDRTLACGPDPSPLCIAQLLLAAFGAIAESGASGFSAAEASTRPCPSDVSRFWHNCAGRLELDGGGVYVGTFRSDKRHGIGHYRFADGETYAGQWRDNQRDGRGESVFTSGDLYVGDFREGHASGRGVFIWGDDGTRYVGEFRNLEFEGRGILYAPDGRVISAGEWRQDELVRNISLDPAHYPFLGDTPMATSDRPTALSGSPTLAPDPSARAAVPVSRPAQSACTQGPWIEPVDYASPEYIGRPDGRRARMCFYRSDGPSLAQLRFFPGGIFYQTAQNGAAGFAMSGSVLQTIRGTYGFSADGRLSLRIAYSGAGVAQTTRGAGSQTGLDVSGSDQIGRPFTLPNCQVITLHDETRRVTPAPSAGGHPDHIIVDGLRWERDSDCGDWEGWK